MEGLAKDGASMLAHSCAYGYEALCKGFDERKKTEMDGTKEFYMTEGR